MAEGSGTNSGWKGKLGNGCDSVLAGLERVRLRELGTISLAFYETLKKLKDVLIVLILLCFLIGIWFLHLFNSVPEKHCILTPNVTLTPRQIREHNHQAAHWLIEDDGSHKVCGKGPFTVCPSEYSCVENVREDFRSDNFRDISTSFAAVLVIALNDFWEPIYQKVLITEGKWNLIFFVFLIMISYCVVSAVLAVVIAAFDVVWIKERRKLAEQKKSEKQIGDSTAKLERHADIPFIDNGDSENDDKTKRSQAPKSQFFKILDVACGWECCLCCDRFKEFVSKFIFDPFIQMGIVLCLIIHVATLASDQVNMSESHANYHQITNYVLHVIFTLEAILKIIALSPKGYFTEFWNRFEFAIVILGILRFGLEGVQGLSILGALELMKVLRLARFWPTYELLYKMGRRSMKIQLLFFVIIGIFLLLAACAGTSSHSDDYVNYKDDYLENPRWHFMDYGHSFMAVFRALCGEWVEDLEDCLKVSGWKCVPLFAAVVIIGDFILVSLFTVFLLYGIVPKEGEKERVSSIIQILSDGADRFIRVWTWFRSKLCCKQSTRIQTLNGTSKRSGDASTVEILADQNVSYVSLEEIEKINIHDSAESNPNNAGPGPCFPDSCYKCLPRSISDARFFVSLRKMCYVVVQTKIFELVTILVILFTVVCLALDDIYTVDKPNLQNFLSTIYPILLLFYIFELSLRLIGRGCKDYFKSRWRTNDFAIVTICCLNWLCGVSGLGSVNFIKVLLVLKFCRVLGLTWKFDSARVVFNTMFECSPDLINVFLIGFTEWIVFAIIGVQLFGGKFDRCLDLDGDTANASLVPNFDACRRLNYTWVSSEINFDNTLNGFLALFQIATFKGWISIIHNAVDSKAFFDQPEFEVNIYMFIYFLIFIVFVSYFSYVMWLSTIIDGYNKQREKTASRRRLTSPGDIVYFSAIKNLTWEKSNAFNRATNNKLQAVLQSYLSSALFDIALAILITLNIITLACHHYEPSDSAKTTLLILDIFFMLTYAVEMFLRIVVERAAFFRNWINMVDVVAVLLSAISIAYEDIISSYIIPPMALRLIRLIEIFHKRKWTRRLTGFNCLISALHRTIPYLLVVSAILAVMMVVYSIIGVCLFKNVSHLNPSDDPYFNFQTFGNGLTILCQIFTTAAWDGFLIPLISRANCDEGCVQPIIGVFFIVHFVLVANILMFTTLTVIVLQVYNETSSQRKLIALLGDCADGFYQMWSQYDPTLTGYIPLKDLSSFLSAQNDPLRVNQPNQPEIAAMDITIVKGDRVHHRDVLDALYRRVLVREGKPVSSIENFESLPHTEDDYEPVSSTLWRKREINSAKIIQATWAKYKSQKLT